MLANATAAALPMLSRAGVLRARAERERAGAILADLRLVAHSLDVPVSELSGGNQQKVVLGRALLRAPKVLICDEPTRGVDVGAKDELYGILIRLAAAGVGIIVISSEVKELLMLSHRVLVMRDGAVVAEFETRAGERGPDPPGGDRRRSTILVLNDQGSDRAPGFEQAAEPGFCFGVARWPGRNSGRPHGAAVQNSAAGTFVATRGLYIANRREPRGRA